MITMIAAAALAAAQPTAPAPAGPAMQHDMHMPMDQALDHQGMDCCKHCCDDMDANHDKHGASHQGHSDR